MSSSKNEMKKKEAIERVISDPNRTSYETETILRFNRKDNKLHVNSFDPTIIKGLLKHKLFKVDSYSRNEHDRIIGVSGHLPRGVLKVKKKPRKRDFSSTIVST